MTEGAMSVSMRVVECNVCGEALSAANDDELVEQLRLHLKDEHEVEDYDEDEARELIEEEAYEASDS